MLVDNVNLLSEEGWSFFLNHCRIPPLKRPPHISMTSTPQELETYFRRSGFTGVKQGFDSLWVITYGKKPGKGWRSNLKRVQNSRGWQRK